jgi:hypothetical protein
VLLDLKFRIWYVWDCPTITADIAALASPFNSLPPALIDLEKDLPLYPSNTIPPVIAGKNIVGGLLKVIDDGTWTGTSPFVFSYQWQHNGMDILGETASTYICVLADLGQTITCVVTATNIVGSVSAVSNSITIV